jgi:hypothetical protein
MEVLLAFGRLRGIVCDVVPARSHVSVLWVITPLHCLVQFQDMLRLMSLDVQSLSLDYYPGTYINPIIQSHKRIHIAARHQTITKHCSPPTKQYPHNMPYHADSTTRALFIRDHIHAPATLQEVLCSLCRQRCNGSHQVVQITAHPECQCVFGQTCLLQWLASNSAASNTCPSCKAVLYNAKGEGSEEDGNSDSDSDSEGDGDENADEDGDEDSRDDGEEGDVRGRRRSRLQYEGRTRRYNYIAHSGFFENSIIVDVL